MEEAWRGSVVATMSFASIDVVYLLICCQTNQNKSLARTAAAPATPAYNLQQRVPRAVTWKSCLSPVKEAALTDAAPVLTRFSLPLQMNCCHFSGIFHWGIVEWRTHCYPHSWAIKTTKNGSDNKDKRQTQTLRNLVVGKMPSCVNNNSTPSPTEKGTNVTEIY